MKGTLAFDTAKIARCGLCRSTRVVRVAKCRGRNEAAYTTEARRLGWSRTRKFGWVCPRHHQKEWR